MSQSHTVTLPVGLGMFALLWTPVAQQAAIAYSAIALGVVFLILAFVSQAKQQQHRTLKLQALEQLVEKSQLDNQKLLTTTQTAAKSGLKNATISHFLSVIAISITLIC